MRRWAILIAAVAMQACLGGIYAWSIFVPGLQRQHLLSMRETQVIFGACILVFTMSMVVAGRLLPNVGPRILAGTGGVLFGVGYVLASLSGRFSVLFLGISVISGVGIGLAYVCPIVTCMKWFPRNRGLVTGVTVAGFGTGAVILSNLAAVLLDSGWGVLSVFRLVGLVYGVVIFAAALIMTIPAGTVSIGAALPPSITVMRDPCFWVLALGMFSGTFAGLVVIGALESMGESWGVPHAVAVGAISALAVGNGLGRITWGWLFDRLGLAVIPGSLVFLALALILFQAGGSQALVFLLAATLVGFGFGACFVVYVGAAAHIYGTGRVGTVYSLVFLAYGFSAVVGPSLGGVLYDVSGNYRSILAISVALPALAAAVFFVARGRLVRAEAAVLHSQGG